MPPGSPCDEDLIAAYYECSEAAFEELYARHFGKVVVYFLRRGLQPADAEDLTEDVFVRIALTKYTGEGRFDPSRGEFKPWIWRIAGNAFVERARKLHVRRPPRQLDPEVQEECLAVKDEPPPSMREEDAPGLALLASAVRECLCELPDEWQEVLALRESGLSGKQIAEALQLKPPTAASRLHRARLEVHKLLEVRGFCFVPRGGVLPPGGHVVLRFPDELLIFVPPTSSGE